MSAATPTPTSLERLADDRLRIAWSDGGVREYSARELREGCPCATCREKHGAAAPADPLAVIPIEETRPVGIAAMRPTGAYAYAIHFTDGHNTGLFTIDRLLEMGQSVEP